MARVTLTHGQISRRTGVVDFPREHSKEPRTNCEELFAFCSFPLLNTVVRSQIWIHIPNKRGTNDNEGDEMQGILEKKSIINIVRFLRSSQTLIFTWLY